MFSVLLTPDTPQWLILLTLVVFVGVTIGMLIWGAILEIRYISPYTIIRFNTKEKWRRAVILALLQTGVMPFIGLIQPILSPIPDQWPIFPIVWGGLWVVVLLIVVLYKRWEFERHIKRYQKIDRMLKSGAYNRLLAGSLVDWMKVFMSAEQKRFWDEGYPEDMKKEEGN